VAEVLADTVFSVPLSSLEGREVRDHREEIFQNDLGICLCSLVTGGIVCPKNGCKGRNEFVGAKYGPGDFDGAVQIFQIEEIWSAALWEWSFPQRGVTIVQHFP
jgi:hypothetical protein